MNPCWTIDEARKLCTELRPLAAHAGFHICLTGGLLYREGARKDLDLVFVSDPRKLGRGPNKLLLLDSIGHGHLMWIREDKGRVVKAHLDGKPIDLIFPGYSGCS